MSAVFFEPSSADPETRAKDHAEECAECLIFVPLLDMLLDIDGTVLCDECAPAETT